MAREEIIDWLYRLKSEIKIFMPYQWQKPFEEALDMGIKALAQEPQSFKWCTDCKEYDTEKHCCHRYSKVIRDTVAEIRQEPILDKIKEVVCKWKADNFTDGYAWDCMKEIAGIVDKGVSEE